MVETNNSTIAKNTLLLYFRMVVTMVISLYTSRVILQILGVDDYGIYQVVGGVVGFLSFINSALGSGSSRFITFGLGEGDFEKLKKIFSTTLIAHVSLAFIIMIIAETIGLWFLYNKLIIPTDRMDAAVYAFHFSIFTAFFNLTQVPYNACIIAHERMNFYAYMSILDATVKLLIVYALTVDGVDKLKLYATLLFLLQFVILTFYSLYCRKHFEEARLRIYFENNIFKEIASFSGWSLFAGCAIALNNQGVLLLLNMFFSPAVVAARAISLQVNMAANQFVTNFQTASIPQIVKRYAANDYEGSKQVLLQTAKFSYFLMLVLSLPIYLVADRLLQLWLGVVPPYTVIFLQIIIIQSLFQVFDTTFYYALYAKGRLRENALISPTLLFIEFPVVYFMFRAGFSPVALSWASFVVYALLGFVVKPILITKIVKYKWQDVISVYIPCLKVTIASLPLPLVVYYYLHNNHNYILSFLIIVIVSTFAVICSSWYYGIDKQMRIDLLEAGKCRIKSLF